MEMIPQLPPHQGNRVRKGGASFAIPRWASHAGHTLFDQQRRVQGNDRVEAQQRRAPTPYGCDRAIPNELRSLLPGLRNLRPLLLSHRHGLRSQVPLMGVLPNATKPDHPQVQDDLSACDGP